VLFPWKRKSRSGSGKWSWLAKLWPQATIPASEPEKSAEEKSAAELNVAR
jgi:hypothetical protein